MNGPDAVREIRRLGCKSFIVGVTGNMLDEDVNYFKAAGAHKVLPKPLRIGDLQASWTENGVVPISERLSV